jgi:hypothetical protein
MRLVYLNGKSIFELIFPDSRRHSDFKNQQLLRLTRIVVIMSSLFVIKQQQRISQNRTFMEIYTVVSIYRT